MRAERNEMGNVRRDFSENGAEVSSDVDAPASFVRVTKRVVFQERMEGILLKEPDAFVCSLLFRRAHLLISPGEVAVKNYCHSRR